MAICRGKSVCLLFHGFWVFFPVASLQSLIFGVSDRFLGRRRRPSHWIMLGMWDQKRGTVGTLPHDLASRRPLPEAGRAGGFSILSSNATGWRPFMLYAVWTCSPIYGNFNGTYGYGLIPIHTIFNGMNIHKSQLFWCEQKGDRVLFDPSPYDD